MLYFWCVITVLWSSRMSLFLGNEYWSSGQGGVICHHIHTYQMLAKWKWKVCVCVCVCVYRWSSTVFQFFFKKIWRGNICGKRVVPFLLSGRKRRGNAAGDSDGVVAVILSLSHVWLFAIPWTAAHQASPVLLHLPKCTQTHVHWVTDAIQPSHPLSSPFPPAFNLSQHQGMSSSNQVAKVLELQPQHQSFQWKFRVDFLQDRPVWSPWSPRTSKSFLQQHSLKTSVLQCSAFFMVQLSHL